MDETAAYVQSLAMLLLFMVAFMSLQRRNEDPIETIKDDALDQEGATLMVSADTLHVVSTNWPLAPSPWLVLLLLLDWPAMDG